MRVFHVFLTMLVAISPAAAQEAYAPARVTAEDYARAERFMGQATSPLVYGMSVSPVWRDDGRFWYRNETRSGVEFVMVDPARAAREPAFDHGRLAAALSAVTGQTYRAEALPFRGFELSADGRSLEVNVGRAGYRCDLGRYRCESVAAGMGGGSFDEVRSPDGTKAAFTRDADLWVRELATGREHRVTFDGQEDFGYATNNAGWTKSDRPVVVWSPDSEKIATFQHDARGVGMMYLVSTEVGHPELEAWRYPLPEDSVIFRIHRVIVDVSDLDDPEMVRLEMGPDPHRSTQCDHVVCGGVWSDVQWSPDGETLAFVSTSRDHKEAVFRIADAETGEVRTVMSETVPTYYESGNRATNWRYLPETDELIWFSERDDWGHLYLYDLDTGRVKNRITSGDWPVWQIVRVDEEARTLWFTAGGREAGRDPYFTHLYRVGFDGSGLTLLTPEDANHDIDLGPQGRYFVDSYSTPTTPPITVVRDMAGRKVLELERGDIAELVASGWKAPIPFSVKARDGETDLHGLMYTPTRLDESMKYPVVNYVYPGPQSGSVGSRSFRASRGDKQALAELGFIVVELDGMGTPGRSKSFHDAYYGNMGDNTLPDQIGAIRQLAERYGYLDLDRVGIWGHSGGGFAAARAIMAYPDFYKVAVSQAGNHDNRNYEDDWAEKWQGLLVENPDGTTNYDNQANQLLAENLEGKLLIAHGTMDSNVPPSNTMVVVDALIDANKDFDLILFPNRRHGFSYEPYMIRRRWDYFVRWLLGAEPPASYEIGASR